MAHCYWHDIAGAAAGDVVTLTGEEAHHAAVVSRMRRGERVLVSDGLGTLAEGVIDRAERDGVDVVTLTGEEAHHAAVVSRMRRGERVLVSDGLGTLAEGVIDRAERDGVDVVLQRVEVLPAPSPRIGLAQALAKGDRAELAVQASTELGVDAIVPWQARRSVVQWKGERGDKALDRWRKVVREAGKQAIRPRLPEIGEVVDTEGLARLAETWRLVVLDPTAADSLADVPLDRDVLLVVGPEGGVDPVELERLVAAGAARARMGDHVLRTSTAGLAAIAALSLRLGRW